MNVRVAVAEPLACGVNATWNERLWPAARVAGKEIPSMVNSELELDADETVTAEPPAFRLPAKEAVLRTVTLPKDNEAGVADNVPCWPDPLLPLGATPWQPANARVKYSEAASFA